MGPGDGSSPGAIYVDGPWWAWLERRSLTPPIVEAPRYATLVRTGGRLGPWPAELSQAMATLPAEAPAGESFRAWLLRHVDAKTAEAIVAVAFIFTARPSAAAAPSPWPPISPPRPVCWPRSESALRNSPSSSSAKPPGHPGPVTTMGPFPPGRCPDQLRITATLGNVGQSDHGHAGNEGR